MTFKKGTLVKINWGMGSMNGPDYPKGTLCKVTSNKELRVVATDHIIPVNVNNSTVQLPTKLEKILV